LRGRLCTSSWRRHAGRLLRRRQALQEVAHLRAQQEFLLISIQAWGEWQGRAQYALLILSLFGSFKPEGSGLKFEPENELQRKKGCAPARE